MPATWLSHLEHQWDSLAWRPWLESAVRATTRCCATIRAAAGLSDRAPGELSFETWMRDIEAVVDAAGFKQFDIVAICWGGPIGVEYAARHPERVARLVLYGAYSLGAPARRNNRWRPKARVLLDMMRLGWGQKNHAFSQVWGNYFQPGGTLEHLRSWSEQQAFSTSAADGGAAFADRLGDRRARSRAQNQMSDAGAAYRARYRGADRGRPQACDAHSGLPFRADRRREPHAARRRAGLAADR